MYNIIMRHIMHLFLPPFHDHSFQTVVSLHQRKDTNMAHLLPPYMVVVSLFHVLRVILGNQPLLHVNPVEPGQCRKDVTSLVCIHRLGRVSHLYI